MNALSNKSSLGVAVALPLYKQCKVKRVEKLFLGILNKSTRCYLDLYEFEIKKLLKTECKKLHSLGYDNFEVRSLIYNTHFLPKRVVNSIVRHSGKTKYSAFNVPKFILYRDFIDSPSISYVLENNAVSDFFYHSSVFSRGMPTKKIKQHFLISSIYLAFKGLCCVIKFRDRATPFRVFLSQYDKFQAYLT